jgi:hypothetical protein
MDHTPAIAELERINRAGWPPLESERVGGWELRFSRGYTKRINSANALPGAGSLARHLPAIEDRYQARGLDPVVRITPLTPPDSDDVLEAAGYAPFDPSPVLLCPLDETAAASECEIAGGANREWLDGFAQAQGLDGGRRTKQSSPPSPATSRTARCATRKATQSRSG